MKISRERLIDELALKFVEVRELRDELKRVTKERDSYKECWETSCWTHDELTIPLEAA